MLKGALRYVLAVLLPRSMLVALHPVPFGRLGLVVRSASPLRGSGHFILDNPLDIGLSLRPFLGRLHRQESRHLFVPQVIRVTKFIRVIVDGKRLLFFAPYLFLSLVFLDLRGHRVLRQRASFGPLREDQPEQTSEFFFLLHVIEDLLEHDLVDFPVGLVLNVEPESGLEESLDQRLLRNNSLFLLEVENVLQLLLEFRDLALIKALFFFQGF